jgi:hypothetical protein
MASTSHAAWDTERSPTSHIRRRRRRSQRKEHLRSLLLRATARDPRRSQLLAEANWTT